MIANTYVVKPFGISEVKVIALKGEPGGPTQEQVNTAVEEYMDDHPEHTIPDGSITEQKLSEDAVTTDKIADESVTTDKLANNVTTAYADNLVSSSYVSDSEPYLFRKTFAGVREDDELVGGSVVWNQLCNSASVTIPNGRKYFMKKGTDYSIGASTGTAITGLTSWSDMVIDLTLMFGPTVADYIYSLEQATAGAGVAWCKAYNPKMFSTYQPYNAGTLISVNTSAHKMVGFNQWDEEWENGRFNLTTGQKARGNGLASKNKISVFPNTTYYANCGAHYGNSLLLLYYDIDENLISYEIKYSLKISFTTPRNARYVNFNSQTSSAVTIYNNDICINLSDPSRNGQYEPYDGHVYPLDSSLTLQGLLKLDGDNLYYDGDIYKADGTVTRRYGIVDMGTLNWESNTAGGEGNIRMQIPVSGLPGMKNYSGWSYTHILCSRYPAQNVNVGPYIDKSIGQFNNLVLVYDTDYTDAKTFKAAMSGVYLVYELATPTTETADPFTNSQVCYPNGTEEYIDTRDVPIPVGHNTKYMRDLKKLLEGIPDAPSANGTYVLKATVSSSGVTYAWIAG